MKKQQELTMPFGKYKGTKLSELPKSYVYGLKKNCMGWIRSPLKEALMAIDTYKPQRKYGSYNQAYDEDLEEAFLSVYW
jgi:uncharacterized protein (DUF3820 family)